MIVADFRFKSVNIINTNIITGLLNKNLYFLYFISFLFSYFEINTYVCVTLN